MSIYGNGEVVIGNNCDLGPRISFLTGSHHIGNSKRRAGKGILFKININSGSWIGVKSVTQGNT